MVNREAERKRLVELLDNSFKKELGTNLHNEILDKFARNLLDNGVVVSPVKVGQTVYYVSDSPLNLSVQANTIYEADVVRIVTTSLGTSLVIQIRNEYGCTEIPDISDWGKTVFTSREDAKQALVNYKSTKNDK